MQYSDIIHTGLETNDGEMNARGGATEVNREAVQREVRLPVGVMTAPICDAPQKRSRKHKGSALEVVQGVRAARGRSSDQMATAARALEILQKGRQARVSQVRTALALGVFESAAKIDFLVERILEEVDKGSDHGGGGGPTEVRGSGPYDGEDGDRSMGKRAA